MGVIRGGAAHLGLVDACSLAGVMELSQVPHHLGEEVTRVVVVRFTDVRFAQKITPVRLPFALAGDTELGEVGLAGDDHATGIFCFGEERNRRIQDASFRLLLLLVAVNGVDAVPLVIVAWVTVVEAVLSIDGPDEAGYEESSTPYSSHGGRLKRQRDTQRRCRAREV